MGECNEILVSSPGTGWTWTSGYKVQLACQFIVPTGSTPQIVSPAVPASEIWSSNGSAYTSAGGGGTSITNGGGFQSGGLAQEGTPAPSLAACTPSLVPNAEQPVMWVASNWVPYCTTGSGVTPSALYGGTSDLAAIGSVEAITEGAAFTASDSHSYQSVSESVSWQFMANPNDSHVGGSGLGHPIVEPVAPFQGSSSCTTSNTLGYE